GQTSSRPIRLPNTQPINEKTFEKRSKLAKRLSFFKGSGPGLLIDRDTQLVSSLWQWEFV
ncbi:MAG: hypothetical protein KDN04_20705, partial [Verrucomicrobiae bacterium]|nr:hypothetical protein [Verrucomicrobiae bacterium]